MDTIETQIDKLQKGISNPYVSEPMKEKMREALSQLEMRNINVPVPAKKPEPTTQDLKKRLRILELMVKKNPKVKPRMKILELMIKKAELAEKEGSKTKKTPTSKGKIKIKDVEIINAEGNASRYDKFPKKYTSWKAVNDALKPIAKGDKGEELFNKINFNITFADGSEYKGSTTVTGGDYGNPYTSSNVIGEHIKNYLNYELTGVADIGDERRKEIQKWISNYDLGVAEPKRVNKVSAQELVGKMKKWAKDNNVDSDYAHKEKYITEEDVEIFMSLGVYDELIMAFYCGIEAGFDWKGDVDYGGVQGIFVLMDDYIKPEIERAIKYCTLGKFEIGMKYPHFDWDKILKGKPEVQVIDSKEYEIPSTKEKYINVYKILKYPNVVVGGQIGKRTDMGGGIVWENQIDESANVLDSSYLGFVSSDPKSILNILKSCAEQKDGGVKDINVLVNGLGGTGYKELDLNKVKYADGGQIHNQREYFGLEIVKSLWYEEDGHNHRYEKTEYETGFKTEEEAKNRIEVLEEEDTSGEIQQIGYYVYDAEDADLLIPNNYNGKNPEEVWNGWSTDQRKHFLTDHYNQVPMLNNEEFDARDNDFKDLNPDQQEKIIEHVSNTQYAKGGSVPRANNSPLIRYANFKDESHINLLRLNPLKRGGLPYKSPYKYAVSVSSKKDGQEVFEFTTLKQAEAEFDKLVAKKKEGSSVDREGKTSNYADGGQIRIGQYDSSIGNVASLTSHGTYWHHQILSNKDTIKKIEKFLETKSGNTQEDVKERNEAIDYKKSIEAENLRLMENFGGSKGYDKWLKNYDERSELPFAKGGQTNLDYRGYVPQMMKSYRYEMSGMRGENETKEQHEADALRQVIFKYKHNGFNEDFVKKVISFYKENEGSGKHYQDIAEEFLTTKMADGGEIKNQQDIEKGHRVKIVGTQFDGMEGLIISNDLHEGKHHVQMSDGKIKGIEPTNLKKLSDKKYADGGEIKKYENKSFSLGEPVLINIGQQKGKGVGSFWVSANVSNTHPNRITVERDAPYGGEKIEHDIQNKYLTSDYVVKEKDSDKYEKGGQTDDQWMQDAEQEMEKDGTVGLFTKKAEKAGKTTIEYAKEVLNPNNKSKFDLKTRREAQFMKNANPELFAEGGEVENPNRFTYMMLSRLQMDNDYFLGAANGETTQLWGITVDDHIAEMKRLWNSLPENGKPEWLSMEDILDYETKMKNYKKKEIPELKEGGQIGKDYGRKEGKRIWTEWTVEQREHFMTDHWDEIEKSSKEDGGKKLKKSNIESWAEDKFDTLPIDIQMAVGFHVKEGQYAEGGEIDRDSFRDTDAVWVDKDGQKWLIDYQDMSDPNSDYFFTLYDEEDDDVLDERSDYYTYEQILTTDSFKPLGYYRGGKASFDNGGETKKKNKRFGVFLSGNMIGEVAYAQDIFDLINNKMLKRWSNWEVIKYKDDDGNTVKVTKYFMDDDDMSIQEVIDDYYVHASEEDLEEEIAVLDPKNRQSFGNPKEVKGWLLHEQGGELTLN